MIRRLLPLVGLVLLWLPAVLGAQQIPGEFTSTPGPVGEGWEGFTDSEFMLNALAMLALAAVLGAVISFHPRRLRIADTLEEIEAPKVSIMYAVIGSLIGIMVVKWGMVVGFVLFGIGGLIRFRTVMRSAHLTGQVILATLIGLSCGLELPHVAVLTTAFDFVLTFLLEIRVTYQLDVRGLPTAEFATAATAYRHALGGHGFRIQSEKKYPTKGRICFIFRTGGSGTRRRIENIVEQEVPLRLRGTLDWELD
ncbi:MAG: hypothetical protein KJP18_10960 [Gemmatimonadetes bacterium]|nr:hypothetical protein [Gemmatimonadota bacterium]NNK62865.1 hypothetical protein [Gemmatimonadota bacterium]